MEDTTIDKDVPAQGDRTPRARRRDVVVPGSLSSSSRDGQRIACDAGTIGLNVTAGNDDAPQAAHLKEELVINNNIVDQPNSDESDSEVSAETIPADRVRHNYARMYRRLSRVRNLEGIHSHIKRDMTECLEMLSEMKDIILDFYLQESRNSRLINRLKMENEDLIQSGADQVELIHKLKDKLRKSKNDLKKTVMNRSCSVQTDFFSTGVSIGTQTDLSRYCSQETQTSLLVDSVTVQTDQVIGEKTTLKIFKEDIEAVIDGYLAPLKNEVRSLKMAMDSRIGKVESQVLEALTPVQSPVPIQCRGESLEELDILTTDSQKEVPLSPQGSLKAAVVVMPHPRGKTRKNRAPKDDTSLDAPAVTITVLPDSGLSYAEVLKRLRRQVDPKELGIKADDLKLSKTATGATLLKIAGNNGHLKADLFARKLKAAVRDTEVKISRPIRKTEILIQGIDESISEDDISKAIAAAGDCLIEDIRIGVIRFSPKKTGTVWVRCPLTASRKIGWREY